MTHEHFTIESREVRVFVGANGKEFATESEALVSVIREKLEALFADNAAYGDISIDNVVDTIIFERDTLSRWLKLIPGAAK